MICRTCTSEFLPTNYNVTHHDYECRECRNARNRQSKAKRKAEGWKDYYPQNRQRQYNADSKYRKKAIARATTRMLIKRGKLIKDACKICGSTKTEAHHED